MKINYSQVKDLELEQNIVDSLNEIAELDYVKEISVSRDIHFCKDIPVGVMVKASRFNAKWIGSDIGCGVSMVELPKGFIDNLTASDIDRLSNELNRGITSSYKLGTIGGGNHFVEFGFDEETGKEYVTIHSGSRQHGDMIANMISEFDLPDHLKYKLYKESVKFAVYNHESLIHKIDKKLKLKNYIPHNYCIRENDTYIHFKGSMLGNNGKALYPIPANMRDGVFVISVATDQPTHLPHGAGRILSRRQARDKFTNDDLIQQTSGLKNQIHLKNIDELPDSYKNINDVLNPLVDMGLIKIVRKVKPVYNFKG